MSSSICYAGEFRVEPSFTTRLRRTIALDRALVTTLLNAPSQLQIGDRVGVGARVIRSLLDKVGEAHIMRWFAGVIWPAASKRNTFTLATLIDAVEAGRINAAGGAVVDVGVEIRPLARAAGILGHEAPDSRVVVSGAVVIQGCLGIGFAGRVLEEIAECSSGRR